jgi:hypothetical protein
MTSPENAGHLANLANLENLAGQEKQGMQENQPALKSLANDVLALKNLHAVNQHRNEKGAARKLRLEINLFNYWLSADGRARSHQPWHHER